MPEAKLNAVKSAETQVNGEIRCRVNITTPEGYDWETDYIVDPGLQVSVGEDPAPPPMRLTGLQKDITEWVLANPEKVKPVTLMDGPVERQDPTCLNPDPPPEMPPPGMPSSPSEIEPPPVANIPELPDHDLEAVAAKMPEPQLEPDPEE